MSADDLQSFEQARPGGVRDEDAREDVEIVGRAAMARFIRAVRDGTECHPAALDWIAQAFEQIEQGTDPAVVFGKRRARRGRPRTRADIALDALTAHRVAEAIMDGATEDDAVHAVAEAMPRAARGERQVRRLYEQHFSTAERATFLRIRGMQPRD